MSQNSSPDYDNIIAALKNSEGRVLQISDILQLAEEIIQSIKSEHTESDGVLTDELSSIMELFHNTRMELSQLTSGQLTKERIPAAGHELDAIVQHTEEATNLIMSAAEEIMGAPPEDAAAYAATVNNAAIKILEACSFQDITGQRIRKIVDTFSVIENRISRFADILGVEIEQPIDHVTTEEAAAQARRDRLLLHGPQDAKDAIEQDEIDAIMSGDEISISQDDIDALFD